MKKKGIAYYACTPCLVERVYCYACADVGELAGDLKQCGAVPLEVSERAPVKHLETWGNDVDHSCNDLPETGHSRALMRRGEEHNSGCACVNGAISRVQRGFYQCLHSPIVSCLTRACSVLAPKDLHV